MKDTDCFDPCPVCLASKAPNAGGAHPLTHVEAGAMALCVDVGVAAALESVWSAGLSTSNSCQSWGTWLDEPALHPCRIDFPDRRDAHAGRALLELTDCWFTSTRWGHTSLLWLPTARGDRP